MREVARAGMSPILLALTAGIAALAVALAVRHLVVEPQAVSLLCDNPGGPYWCLGREALIFLFRNEVFAFAAVTLAVASLLARRPAAGLAASAVAFGAAGAVLYNLEWAVPGLLLGLLRAARLDAGPAGD